MDKYSGYHQMGRFMNGNSSYRGDMRVSTGYSGQKEGCCREKKPYFECLDDFPLAMAYVPEQKYTTVYDREYALKVGTIFPELCKPFCGKGGRCS